MVKVCDGIGIVDYGIGLCGGEGDDLEFPALAPSEPKPSLDPLAGILWPSLGSGHLARIGDTTGSVQSAWSCLDAP